MRRTLVAALVVFLLLLVSGVAYAATLYTSPILIDGDRYVRCSLTNVGTVPYVVRIDVLNGTGASQASLRNITIDPGESQTNVFGFATVNVCKFTVPVPSRVRAGGCVSAFGSLTCLDSSPAR